MSQTNPSQSETVGLSIPKELAEHGRRRVEIYLRNFDLPATPSIKDAMLSMFVAGWLDWALSAPLYVKPEVVKKGQDNASN